MRLRELAERQLPGDEIRPEFMENVISPLGHAVIAYTFDNISEPVLESLSLDTNRDRIIKNIRSSVTVNNTVGGGLDEYDPEVHAVPALRVLADCIDHGGYRNAVPPVWDTMGTVQKVATKRFTTFGSSYDPDGTFFGFGVNGGYRTVVNAFSIMASRHPELDLKSMDGAAKFLEDPVLPRLMRGLAAGGNGFMDSYRNPPMNSAPPTKPWREDMQKAVIDTTNSTPRPHAELAAAALQHRDYTKGLSEATFIGRNGLAKMGMRESTGCPVRVTTFDPEKPSQLGGRLHLNDRQLALLLDYPDPVAEVNVHAEKGDPYRIRRERDGYTVTSQFLARCLRQLHEEL